MTLLAPRTIRATVSAPCRDDAHEQCPHVWWARAHGDPEEVRCLCHCHRMATPVGDR
jgi:hypothetical protein